MPTPPVTKTDVPVAAVKPVTREIRLELDVSNRAAVEALAELLGEIAADLWLAGKFDPNDDSLVT